jgi:hypothetical protein
MGTWWAKRHRRHRRNKQMPLTEKGSKIKSAMQEQYGKERGEQVFYASRNKGTISGVDNMPGIGGSSTSSIANALNTTGSSQAPIMDQEEELTDDEENTGLVLDADLTPERRDEIVGDIPKEKAGEPKSKSNLPDKQTAAPTVTSSLTRIGDRPMSYPVGDQSLSNMNSRNRSFWKR